MRYRARIYGSVCLGRWGSASTWMLWAPSGGWLNERENEYIGGGAAWAPAAVWQKQDIKGAPMGARARGKEIMYQS
jgi:hypothetical protein